MITQDKLKSILIYDSETGIFTRKRKGRNKSLPNLKAGTISKGYVKIYVSGVLFSAHRLAWLYVYGEMPDGEIDHINHMNNDNKISNLRVVSHKENRKNAKMNSKNTSGFNGVSKDKKSGLWHAYIRINGKMKHLGYFDDISDAVNARKKANARHRFHKNHGVDGPGCA